MNPRITVTKKLKPMDSVQINLHYLDHHMRVEENEELQSEQRIKFFLALVAGTVAIITSLNKCRTNYDILFWSLLILFILGLVVFSRVVWSDRKIKIHRELIWTSFKLIKDIDQSISIYEDRLKEMDDNSIFLPFRIFKGTLTQLMWIMEGLLSFGIVYFWCISKNWYKCDTYWLSFTTTTIVLLLLSLYAWYIKKGVK